jgi:hypothetical protein
MAGSHTLFFSLCSHALTNHPPTFYIGAKQNPKWRPGQTGQETHRLGSARRAVSTAISANARNLGMESEGGTPPTGAPRREAGAENFWERCGRTDRETDKKRARDEVFFKKKLSGYKTLPTTHDGGVAPVGSGPARARAAHPPVPDEPVQPGRPVRGAGPRKGSATARRPPHPRSRLPSRSSFCSTATLSPRCTPR